MQENDKDELMPGTPLPFEDEEIEDPVVAEMKAAMRKRALGYEAEETYVTVGDDGTKKVTKRKRHIPGDPIAQREYIRLFGNLGGWS